MCNIEKISREKEEFLNNTSSVISISGAVVINAEKKIKELSQKSSDNILELSFLL